MDTQTTPLPQPTFPLPSMPKLSDLTREFWKELLGLGGTDPQKPGGPAEPQGWPGTYWG